MFIIISFRHAQIHMPVQSINIYCTSTICHNMCLQKLGIGAIYRLCMYSSNVEACLQPLVETFYLGSLLSPNLYISPTRQTLFFIVHQSLNHIQHDASIMYILNNCLQNYLLEKQNFFKKSFPNPEILLSTQVIKKQFYY